MAQHGAPQAVRAADDADQRPIYALVILTEIIVIAALYWLGVHFS